MNRRPAHAPVLLGVATPPSRAPHHDRAAWRGTHATAWAVPPGGTGLDRLALLIAGCASPRPRIADETKVEEWGRCSQAQPHFTVLCLQMRRPM